MTSCQIESITVENIRSCFFGLSTLVAGRASDLGYMALTSLLVPTLLVLAVMKLWRVYTDSKDPSCQLPLPPGSMGLPIVGETLNFMAQGSKFFRERTNSYGSIFKTHILGQRTIRVSGAQNIAKILRGEGTLVTSHWPPSTRLILGDGALAHSSGEEHRVKREMILKAFAPKALQSYVPSVQRIVKDHIRSWCEKGNIHGYPEARNLTFTIASRLLLGFDIDDKKKYQMLILFEDMLATLFSMPVPIPGIGLYRGMKARKHIMQEIQSCIEKRTKGGDQSKEENDALGVILNQSMPMTQTDVQTTALEMLFAGHLPTSSAACSVLMLLGSNMKYYDKLSVELFDAGLLEQDKPLTYDNINGIDYLDAVIKEVLRLAPPVGAGYRKALQTFEIDGCQVPKDWTVVYSIRETQHSSQTFDKADRFNPERWIKSSKLSSISRRMPEFESEFDYVPFGWGDRSCVGQKFVQMFLRIFIIELVRSATWRLENGMPEVLYMPVPHPKDNLPLQIRENPPDLRRRAYSISW